MAILYIYNPQTNWVERYYKGDLETMPYVAGGTMTVGEFRGMSTSNILWTDRRLLETWNTFRRGWGRPIYIGYAFKRIWEGGHDPQSQHYAGLAIDMGQTLTVSEREALRAYAASSGLWTYVEPASLAPRWVHVDKRFGTPACPEGGYPTLSVGSMGVYVFVLQDALSALGILGSGLDGAFGPGTQRAVIQFQTAQGIPITGVADCTTWTRLTSLANGIGRTPTVINA